MGEYTQYRDSQSRKELSQEELEEMANGFRRFGDALSTYLMERGKIQDSIDAIDYIVSQVTGIGESIKKDTVKNWFSERFSRVGRSTAILLCFALQLDYNQAEDFLNRICLMRMLDPHNLCEVVYYYGLMNDLEYKRLKEITEKVTKIECVNGGEGLQIYTQTIIDDLESIESLEALVAYITENVSFFSHTRVTAYRYLSELWNLVVKIAPNKSFANEGLIDSRVKDTSITGILYALTGLKEKYLRIEADNKALNKSSMGRSLKKIYKSNKLINVLAAETFPDRQDLNDITKGNVEKMSSEKMRACLILLKFYHFWISIESTRDVTSNDSSSFISETNSLLIDSGLQPFYPGDPYDWIYLYASYSDIPLITFYEFMNEEFYDDL